MMLNFVVLCLSCWLEVCESSVTNLKAWPTQNYRKKTTYMNVYVRDCQITSRLDFLPQKSVWKGSFQRMFWPNFGSFYPRTESSFQNFGIWLYTWLFFRSGQHSINGNLKFEFVKNTIVICLKATKASFNISMMTHSGWRQLYPGLIVIQSNMYLKLSVLICHLVHLCSWFFKFSLNTLNAIF